MKYNFKLEILDLDGNPAFTNGEPVFLNRVIAHQLASQSKGDPVKLFDWSMDLWKTGLIDLDRAGRTDFEKFIRDNEALTILVKGRIFEVLNKTTE